METKKFTLIVGLGYEHNPLNRLYLMEGDVAAKKPALRSDGHTTLALQYCLRQLPNYYIPLYHYVLQNKSV